MRTFRGKTAESTAPVWANGETLIENSYFSDVTDVVDSPTGSDAAGPMLFAEKPRSPERFLRRPERILT